MESKTLARYVLEVVAQTIDNPFYHPQVGDIMLNHSGFKNIIWC